MQKITIRIYLGGGITKILDMYVRKFFEIIQYLGTKILKSTTKIHDFLTNHNLPQFRLSGNVRILTFLKIVLVTIKLRSPSFNHMN